MGKFCKEYNLYISLFYANPNIFLMASLLFPSIKHVIICYEKVM